jgi:hypothetical protein
MILYKKDFPLGEDVSFSSYIKALGKKHFPNYYLRIEKIPSTTNYHATMVFTVPNWEWGLRGPFIDGILLKECTIEYSEGEKHFTIQASARTANLLVASAMVILAIFLFVLVLFMMATNDRVSLNDISILTIAIIFFLVPSTLIYIQDKNFLDKVGSLGTELEKN